MRVQDALVVLTVPTALSILLWSCAGAPEPGSKTRTVSVTFTSDIAPIFVQACSPCHRPGGSAPFSLLSYDEARKRASQIVRVTTTGYMPPWLPAPGEIRFVGARRLDATEIERIRAWVAAGAPQGDPADMPPPARFSDGWDLGAPDLVIELPEPFLLPADGPDVFRNFVFSNPLQERRWVRAVEIRPGNRQVVHHANLLIDRTGASRRRDREDPGIGFEGMDLVIESEHFEPQGHFLFWKPGSPPDPGSEEMCWELDEDTDLVLNMHLQPSGKPERIQPSIGLYFSRHPPTRFPMLLQLEHDGALDIPAGATDFVVSDHLRLPVEVEILGLYPHAHYLGRRIEGSVILPDGKTRRLILIDQWNLDWQAVYKLEQPLRIPKGSILQMEISYDNSVNNPRNPNHPPRRVRAGNQSSDEMSHLWIQVLPPRREDRLLLQIALMERRLEKYPDDFLAHANLGGALQLTGRLGEAIDHFRKAVRRHPSDATLLNNLGAALKEAGALEQAERWFERALQVRPDHPDAWYNLAQVYWEQGRLRKAIDCFQQVLAARPADLEARRRLSYLYTETGDFDAAAVQLTELVRARPQEADLAADLGRVEALRGKLGAAAHWFEQAMRLKPDHAGALAGLAQIYAGSGDPDRAAQLLGRALRADPQNADLLNNLGTTLAALGRIDDAIKHFERALEVDPHHPQARANLARAKATGNGE